MKISTARIDGLMTTIAQKLSLPIQRLRSLCGRRANGARDGRRATLRPLRVRSRTQAYARVGRGLDQALLRARDVPGGRERVHDVHVVGHPALLGREAVRDAGCDGVGREVLHRRALVRVVARAPGRHPMRAGIEPLSGLNAS